LKKSEMEIFFNSFDEDNEHTVKAEHV